MTVGWRNPCSSFVPIQAELLSGFSFYNWETQTSTSNPTPNYQVIAENATGLLFKNKRDRKILNVDPKVSTVYHILAVIHAAHIYPKSKTNRGVTSIWM